MWMPTRAATALSSLFCTFLALIVLTACGGNAKAPSQPNPTSTSPSGATPAPAPGGSTPTPAPGGGTPTGGTGSGGGTPPSGGSASAQWSSTAVTHPSGVETEVGTVTVSTAGDVNVNVSGVNGSTTYEAFFCQYPGSFNDQDRCFSLNQSLITDSAGKGQLTFHFPKAGLWSGSFYFAPGGDVTTGDRIQTDADVAMATVSAQLVSTSKVNNGTGGNYWSPSLPQDPGGGSITIDHGTQSVNLHGGPPNTTFVVHNCYCDGGSACQGQYATTDASGNTTQTYSGISGTGTLIELIRVDSSHAGFVSGFTVP